VDRDQEARDRFLDVRERRLDGIAAELARSLTPGAPCPVCGSPDHPRPGRPSENDVDRAMEESAAGAADRARAERDEATALVSTLTVRSALLAALSCGLDVASASEAVRTAQRELDRAREQHARHSSLVEAQKDATAALELSRQSLTALVEQQSEQCSALAEAQGRLRSVDDELHSLLAGRDGEPADVDEGGDPSDLEEHCVRQVGLVRRELSALDRLVQDRAALESALAAYDAADDRVHRTAQSVGFDDVDAAAASLMDPSELERLAASVATRDEELVQLRAEVGRPELVEAGEAPAPDLPALRDALARAEQELRKATAGHAVVERAAVALRRLHADLSAHELQSHDLRRHHALLDELSRCVDGTGGGNTLRMRLSAYVLAARLEQVAAAATERLAVMSGGRYALVHSAEPARGGGRSGLALRVVDAWTGVERDAVTLSGGESFLASLALALGLADVVQAEAGGTSVETLFVDEGFGTLDDESLDEVMAVLDGLRDGGRAVGVVSHVAEMRQRIPSRIEVVKRRDGSRLVVHDG
jgi:exonuclease SbcC